ncbi:hypothetical protein B0H19DRAFT_650496 [Mycena capillaripes]|nr:hypothetical protein B0H19DRAFT_650496 [Mycena capillaripes]
MLPGPLIVLTVHALFAFGQAYAALTNITIDDTNSTFWTFVGAYNVITSSMPCIDCAFAPDPGLVYNNSWHDGALRSGSFIFQGTAVYIYGVDWFYSANLTFAMSNPLRASSHLYSGDGFVYNSLFFSATNLDASVQHTVTWLMETSASGGGSAIFDYAIVTVDRADVSSSSTSAGTTGGVPSNSTSASLALYVSSCCPTEKKRPSNPQRK